MGLSQVEPKFGFSKKTDVFFKQSTIDDRMRLVGFFWLGFKPMNFSDSDWNQVIICLSPLSSFSQ